MTIQELKAAIAGLKAYGLSESTDPLKKMIADLKQMEAQANETETPMYDTLITTAKFPVTQEKKDCIKEAVDNLLDDSLSPDNAAAPGLLLGNIQCGKTDTFENIIGLAFDRGIDVAIILTKNSTALAEQTRMRAEFDYSAFAPGRGHRVTVNIYDIMVIRDVGLNQSTVDSTKTVIVCKKQKHNLDSLFNLFTSTNKFLKSKKVLIVDDEADFASRNYKKSGRGSGVTLEAQKTTEQIDNFRSVLPYCRYLQVTATPYSLLLQPEGKLNLGRGTLEPFKPRFVAIVPKHDKYIGAEQYFVESRNPDSVFSYVHSGVSPKCMATMYKSYKPYLTDKGHKSPNLFDLEYAVCSYFMATAIRRIQKRSLDSNADYHSSSVFHIEIGRDKHDWQCDLIDSIVEDIKMQLLNNMISTWLQQCMAISSHYFKESIDAAANSNQITASMPSTQKVYDEMCDIFRSNNYRIVKVNSDNVIIHLLNRKTGELQLNSAANIFVGGNVLDRGITIQHLLCFFYGRNPTTFQQDTVLQHARMFGARSLEDMAVTRFHTTPRIYRAFDAMCMMDEDLRQRIISSKKTGEPIGPIFVGYNSEIKPCAPSKTDASDMNAVKSYQRILPIGFMAGYKTHIQSAVSKIENLIISSPGYQHKDREGFFKMDRMYVVEILKLIRETYIYSAYYQNEEFESDITNMRCVLEFALSQAGDSHFVYGWHLANPIRRLNRKRANSLYNDSPEGGKVYIDKMKAKAIDQPVIVFIKEAGDKNIVNGDNYGWNDAEFYWPVLLTQRNLKSAIYTMGNK